MRLAIAFKSAVVCATLASSVAIVGAVPATASDVLPALESPIARAAFLGLPAPAGTQDAVNQFCVGNAATEASFCFSRAWMMDSYLSGRSSSSNAAAVPTGSGGTTATVVQGGYYLGKTCFSSACTSNVFKWYTPSGGGTCTHTYPANDYFRNNMNEYNWFEEPTVLQGGANPSRCRYQVFYASPTQGGGQTSIGFDGGASAYGTAYPSYSISFHYYIN